MKRKTPKRAMPNFTAPKRPPRTVTYEARKNVENLLLECSSIYFIQVGVCNNYASYAMTYAAEKLRQWDGWEKCRPHYNEAVRHYDEYEKFMRVNEMREKFQLYADMTDYVFDSTKRERDNVIANMARVAAQNGIRHSLTAAHLYFALFCIQTATEVCDEINRIMDRRIGTSFNSRRYKKLRLTETHEQWIKVIDAAGMGHIGCGVFCNDMECNLAMSALRKAILDGKVINEASMKAIMENKHLFTEKELEELQANYENCNDGDNIDSVIDRAYKSVNNLPEVIPVVLATSKR